MSETQRGLKGAGLRYTAEDGVPAWAVGKTADEILDLASRQNAYITSLGSGSAQAPQSAPAQSSAYVHPTQNGASVPTPPDPQLNYSDPVEYARQLTAYNDYAMRAQLSAVGVPILRQMSEMARHASRTGAHAEVWRRWEPEIELKLAGIAPEQRTQALYDQAAALVKADHVEELARERAAALGAGGNATERGSGAGAAPTASPPDALEAAFAGEHPFFVKARANGATPDAIRRFCAQTGQSVDDYVKAATSGTVLLTPDGFSRAHA